MENDLRGWQPFLKQDRHRSVYSQIRRSQKPELEKEDEICYKLGDRRSTGRIKLKRGGS
jgi:hypothetical protein